MFQMSPEDMRAPFSRQRRQRLGLFPRRLERQAQPEELPEQGLKHAVDRSGWSNSYPYLTRFVARIVRLSAPDVAVGFNERTQFSSWAWEKTSNPINNVPQQQRVRYRRPENTKLTFGLRPPFAPSQSLTRTLPAKWPIGHSQSISSAAA
jgi:hypothetical protein